MLSDASWSGLFSIERRGANHIVTTQSRSEGTHSGPLHCVVSYWRIFIFAFKMTPELWFDSSKVEAFPNIGESQRWHTLPLPGVFPKFCSVAIIVAAHVVLGVA